jgi:unsaturated chondroitin disaccharide hydrolase
MPEVPSRSTEDRQAGRAALEPQLRRALDLAAERARFILAHYPGYHPMYTVGGRWRREGERWTHWCEGFFPGILWLLHKQTGAAEWRRWAEEYSRRLEPRKHDRTVHDLGFLFFSTYLRWYRLTGDSALRAVLVEAGRTLALRRQRGGYLASFIGPQSLFIDVMMNVGLILWAARQTGDESLRDVALEHCRTSARYLVRADGGTAHEGIFDVATGQFLRESTHQGWRAESTWSRGLAWALYGFTAVHRLSGVAEFLEVARRCAAYYLRRAPAGLVPYWDFDLPPDAPQWRDSSADAIAASLLWDLAEALTDQA